MAIFLDKVHSQGSQTMGGAFITQNTVLNYGELCTPTSVPSVEK